MSELTFKLPQVTKTEFLFTHPHNIKQKSDRNKER